VSNLHIKVTLRNRKGFGLRLFRQKTALALSVLAMFMLGFLTWQPLEGPSQIKRNGLLSGNNSETRQAAPEELQQDTKEAGAHESIEKLSAQARGVHVSFRWAGADDRWNETLALIDSAGLNAVQLDLKDESGRLGYTSQVKMAGEIGSGLVILPMKERLKDLKDRGIYSIARIVVFRDPFLAQKRPDLMVRTAGGSPLAEGTWVDPYSKEVQDYNLDLAIEAYQLGFNEVQFDYIRFPEGGAAETAVYSCKAGDDTRTRVDVIAGYLSYVRSAITWDRLFSATVFGYMSIAEDDQGIGQRPERMAPFVDYLSPMSYPSHYGPGNYGFDNPNAYPYEVIDASLKGFKPLVESSDCRLRPWLQAFSWSPPPYGRNEIRAQINASEDNNIKTWLLWNEDVSYKPEEIAP